MSIEIGVLFAGLGAVLGLAGFFAGRKSEHKVAGKSEGVVLADIGYIKAGIDDIKRKQAEQDKNYVDMLSRMVAVEASTKQAHRRINDIMGRKESREDE